MPKSYLKSQLPIILALGSVWGLAEAGMGMYLRGTCAYMTTGSIMTGIAIFFFAASFAYSRNIWSIGIVFLIASLFKLVDAFFLHLPILHGAIANPIFAFFTEGIAFLFIFAILNESLKTKRYGQALFGGVSALVAVNLFPLVKFATGISACVYPGTQYPTALYFAPIAIGLSLITCPLGFAAGEKIAQLQSEPVPRRLLLPANMVAIISLAGLVLLRVT
ncbi:MAG: hypothetical protein QME64_04010 [bacterium]|nr:hypothetical protein [bacterium]